MICSTNFNDLIAEFSGLNCTPLNLVELKNMYKSDINSKRCELNISNLNHLLNVLIKRDIINEYNITVLKEIATILKVDFNGFVDQLTGSRGYCIGQTIKYSQDVIDNQKEGKRETYSLLANDFGDKWKDFARCLNISEGMIDELQRKEPNISERVYKVLQQHEKSDRRLWRNKLLRALELSRRNDLRKQVELIFDRYNINELYTDLLL